VNEFIKPRYEISMWNTCKTKIEVLQKTSNNAESRNRTINKRVGMPHPNIRKLLETILEIDDIEIFNLQNVLLVKFIRTKTYLKKINCEH
jgi:hypothetical protein